MYAISLLQNNALQSCAEENDLKLEHLQLYLHVYSLAQTVPFKNSMHDQIY